jgi:acyl carrier protein
MTDAMLGVVVRAVRATAVHLDSVEIEATQSFVDDLGFDSVAVVMLSIALEDELHCAVMLDGWIARHGDPSGLTVGSLASYLRESVGTGVEAAV